jgi:hypothetical protein
VHFDLASLPERKKETKAVLHYFTRFLEPLFRELKKKEKGGNT